MKRIPIICRLKMKYLVAIFFCTCFMLIAAAQSDSLNSLQECRTRNGLPNFFYKLNHAKSVTIAYLGGSITAAKDGWRDQSAAWFQKQYPNVVISQINAGVGGTGSDLGAFRVGLDVISHSPDLVFVEFAVNDGGATKEKIYNAMEGIVRQIWRHNRNTDICFVYTVSGQMINTLQKGKLWSSMLAMEQIAEYYRIPSIQFGVKVVALIEEGKLIFQGKPEENPNQIVFSIDNVHPLPQTGHLLYEEALVRSMNTMQDNIKKYRHRLGKPFSKDNWEEATMVSIKDLPKTGDWTLLTARDTLTKDFMHKFPYLYKSNSPGSSFELKFRGRLAGIFDVIGCSSGEVEVQVDHAAPRLFNRFDKYCSYYHFNYFLLPAMEESEHEIKFTLSSARPDKMAILKTGNTKVGDPLKYEEDACYIGWVLLIGKLKK